jgi:hypothetical protein
VQVFQRWDMDMEDFMSTYQRQLDLLTAANLLQQLFNTLRTLRAMKVVDADNQEKTYVVAHNDVKPPNLLVQRLRVGRHKMWVKGLTDFGVATLTPTWQYRMMGTPGCIGMMLTEAQQRQLLPEGVELPPDPCQQVPAASPAAPPDSPRTTAGKVMVWWGRADPVFDLLGYCEVGLRLLQVVQQREQQRQQASGGAAAAAAALYDPAAVPPATHVYATCRHLVAELVSQLTTLKGLIPEYALAQGKANIVRNIANELSQEAWDKEMAVAQTTRKQYQQMDLEELRQLADTQRANSVSDLSPLLAMKQELERRVYAMNDTTLQLLADIMAANPDEELKGHYLELAQGRLPEGEQDRSTGGGRGVLEVCLHWSVWLQAPTASYRHHQFERLASILVAWRIFVDMDSRCG